ncbi:MAG TPA: chemotaxis protein CheB [Gaiellaceae bacterium]|nr:chemotaxis protein CheB [Gaiellaceae bacterium]
MAPPPLRLLLCDDSPTYAAGLRRLVEHDPTLEVVAVHGNAEDAIAALPELAPDLITMDVELPGMNGLEAVERIMSIHPLPILVLSSRTARGGAAAAAACAAGALQAISKEDLNLFDLDAEPAVAFRRRLRMLAAAPVIRHPRASLRQGALARSAPRSLQVIGVCASAGGPQALLELITGLPEGFRVPILAVQHIAEGFTDRLVSWLARGSQIPVRVAHHGAMLQPGVWIAPENRHLRLGPDGSLGLAQPSAPSLYCPSGDVLLHSLAEHAGSRAAGIVLSGMGSDGADGIAALRLAGGLTFAQDEATSGVFGMPKVAAQRGAEHVLPPEAIAANLIKRAT